LDIRNLNKKFGSFSVIDKISLLFPNSGIHSIIGPNGAGKSTLLNLVPRFYDVSGGSVLLDDYDLRDLSLPNVRSASSLVSQDALIFDISIKENIIFGCDGISDEIFLKVCKDSLVDDFVKDLPDKYQTLVGESGVRLSGGQKQRIAIARAMIKDAPILLLDEATSSLDSESEKKVQEALDKLMKDKTALIVAHRLSTIKNVDVIYVIDNGAIVEQGTHKELVNKNGLYAFLFKTQFLGDKVE
jgi:ABC-type multidrug transport system fused ATPase/permease subunit